VANVIKAGLVKYKEADADTRVDSEKATIAIQKEIEEGTALEMPMLEKNMVIISTLVSIGTLVGLLGTVTGMIKAFAALATGGAPDQAQLANGISEALINTATGIATSAVATVMYNVFTTKIDKLTYSIDEAGYSIVQTYASTHNN
jgi:biopolymer transport protein ExbB